MADDQARARDYDDPMSGRLLGIAADVLRSFRSAFGGRHLAIVGGIVPSLLAPRSLSACRPTWAQPTWTSTCHCICSTEKTADYYRAIIDGLRSLGLRPAIEDGRQIKWRWTGQYRDVHLRVELLCPIRTRAGRPEKPAADTTAEANIGPSGEISALAVGYGHLVPADTIIVERRAQTRRGMLSYEFPVAGLTSWLCLKADAIMRRDKPKDSYDVVWLLDALGPDKGSELIASSPITTSDLAHDVRGQLHRLISDQLKDTGTVGPAMYADFLEANPGDLERRHAHGTLTAFGQALTRHGIQFSR